MVREYYAAKSIERAHHWIAKAIDTLVEARALIPSGQTRLGAYSRLYYSAHHTAVALLRLIGNNTKKHQAIISEFGKQWVEQRSFPPRYGKALNTLHKERDKGGLWRVRSKLAERPRKTRCRSKGLHQKGAEEDPADFNSEHPLCSCS